MNANRDGKIFLRALRTQRMLLMADPIKTTTWRPERDAPPGRWLITRRDGEDGTNRCHVRVWPGGDREWIDGDGRTTVTHHSFAAPTHWRFIEDGTDG